MSSSKYRKVKDSMGEMSVPVEAYYAAQTARAIENFPVSGIKMPAEFIRAMALIKISAARTNMSLGLISKRMGQAIIKAATDVADGKLDGEFVLDVFQTGSGTSTNMNTNEVIATRANEILGDKFGKTVHPNDHINMGQSSNDTIPTAMHVSALVEIQNELIPSLKLLQRSLTKKSKQFDKIVKIGRTHLQDATPIRLGQEFSGYASMIEHSIHRLEDVKRRLSELPIGGTAVGTGINTPKKFGSLVSANLSKLTKVKFREADNHFEAQASKDAIVETSSILKTIAVSLMKIANDIRWLGSGPRCGIGEIMIPAVQPGSSIMPGKINPVIAESVTQVSAQVIGNDMAITIGGQSGNFELNVMMPMMAHNLLQSIKLLANVSGLFARKCIDGIQADRKRCEDTIEKSLAMCTSLAPIIGYDNAASIAKEAYSSGKTVRVVAIEKKVMNEKELNRVLNPWSMTEPGVSK